MKIPQKLQQIAARLRQIPKRTLLLTVLGICVITYGVAFFIPRPVEFSYGSDTCVRQLTLFPTLHKTVDDTKVTTSFTKKVLIGSVSLASLRTCFTPTDAPAKGTAIVATAPFGGVLARKHFALSIPVAPTANVSAIDPIPTTKPLKVSLSNTDVIYDYQMKINKTTAACGVDQQTVSCDIVPLKLRQGVSYDFKLEKKFGGEVTETKTGTLTTLKAVAVTKASLKNDQTIYSKPREFTFTTDKAISRVSATIERVDKKSKPLEADAKINGKTITVSFAKDFVREVKYRLILKSVEAIDGSTLTDPYVRDFSLSGGPKVIGINIGTSQVAHTQQVILSFDQPLSSIDIQKFVAFRGGSATIARLSAASISVSYQNLPKCQDFSIIISKGLTSKYGIPTTSLWQHNARTACHTVATIGYSLQGRPIQAYYFGSSGPVTLFVGALHGNEVSSSLLLQDWIDWLEQNGKTLPTNKRIVIVPTANPDGVAAGTRNNSRDVNINRNFPTDNWKKDIDDTDGVNKGGGGVKPLSEPEAKALANLSSSLQPRLLISYHAVGSVVIGDSGGYSAPYAAKYASMVGYRNATGQSSSTFDYNITGSYEDWTIKKVGIPSMVIELGSYIYRDFSHHQPAMWAMLQ